MLIHNKQYHNETSSTQLRWIALGLECVCVCVVVVVVGANKLNGLGGCNLIHDIKPASLYHK